MLPLTFKGKVEADVFNGSLQIAAMGESPFIGKRAKAGASAASTAAPAAPPGATVEYLLAEGDAAQGI